MINAFQKFILWCVAVLAISTVTIFALYKLATIIAIAGGLLIIGFAVGVPLSIVLKSKYKRSIIEQAKQFEK